MKKKEIKLQIERVPEIKEQIISVFVGDLTWRELENRGSLDDFCLGFQYLVEKCIESPKNLC